MEGARLNGKLIVLEGPDGIGKTTIAKMLAEQLKAIYYAFPGKEIGTLGEQVYNLHHNTSLNICPESLQLLHVAAHIDALRNRIIPWLEDNEIVILDRCYWSTWVYGRAYDINPGFLAKLINLELPYWGEHNKTGLLFYITREQPFIDKADDPKAQQNWKLISQYYEATFAYNSWDDFGRIRIENDNSEESCKSIADYISKLA